MRGAFRCLGLFLGSTLTIACTPGGGTSGSGSAETTQATTSASTSGSGPTATSAASDDASGSGGVTSGPVTSGPGSTGPGTTSTSGPVSTGETTSPGTATTETSSAETGPMETSGGPNPAQCSQDSECKLQADCCTCAGLRLDQDPEPCDDMTCKQDRCSELGIDQAVCTFGVCETERLSCDQTQVLCDAPPPPCAFGLLPETSPACWTGRCVPEEYCDVVPDCSHCGGDQMCVQNIGEGPLSAKCLPIPPACGGPPTCACVGDLVCKDPFSFCAEQNGDIHCECINC